MKHPPQATAERAAAPAFDMGSQAPLGHAAASARRSAPRALLCASLALVAVAALFGCDGETFVGATGGAGSTSSDAA